MLECRILTSEAEIEAIAGEWRQLFTHAGRSPFSDYDLFAVWWRVLGKTDGARTLHVVAGRDAAGQLAAILPLTIARRHGMRVMQAAGFKAYNCDMLAGSAGQAIELWNAARQSSAYDFADIRDVYPESLCYEALASFAQRRDENEVFSLQLKWAAGEDWIASLPGDARGKFKRCTRRLEEKGPVGYEIYKEGPLPPAIIDRMVERKMAWASANEKHGLFDYPNVLDYFRQMLEIPAQQKRLFLAWLKCGDDVIAYNQGFIHQGVLHMPFWTHEPAWDKYSPGTVILIHSICWAIDNGLREVDFRQGESQFKRKHASNVRRCAEFTFNRSFKGRLVENAFVSARGLSRLARFGREGSRAVAGMRKQQGVE